MHELSTENPSGAAVSRVGLPDFRAEGSRLQIDVVAQGPDVVVVPKGELDLATVDVLRERLDGAGAGCACVVLDLRELTFIDSTGLRLVVERAQDAPGRFAVIRGNETVQRVFELTGLLGVVPFVDAASAAAA